MIIITCGILRMLILMQKRNSNMDEYLNSLNYALDCSSQRLGWFIKTGDEKYMNECREYLGVANIYMKEVSKEQTVS
jgi:hypothetical protein